MGSYLAKGSLYWCVFHRSLAVSLNKNNAFNSESIIECCSSRISIIIKVIRLTKAKLLYKRLELKCWEGMLDPESPIFEPTLLALVQKKKSKNLKATCQRQL